MTITRYINGVAVSEEELKGYTARVDLFGRAVNRVRARVKRSAAAAKDTPGTPREKNVKENGAIM